MVSLGALLVTSRHVPAPQVSLHVATTESEPSIMKLPDHDPATSASVSIAGAAAAAESAGGVSALAQATSNGTINRKRRMGSPCGDAGAMKHQHAKTDAPWRLVN